ncbi:hypothetical protein ACX4MT_18885 [Roseomonas mucosa]
MAALARTRLIRASKEFRKIHPNIKLSEFEVFLRIAEDEGICQRELIDAMKPSSVGQKTVISRTFVKFASDDKGPPLINMYPVAATFGYNAKLAFLTPRGRELLETIEAIIDGRARA